MRARSSWRTTLVLYNARGRGLIATRKLRFARDSPVEGDGFEPSVPLMGYCGVFRERPSDQQYFAPVPAARRFLAELLPAGWNRKLNYQPRHGRTPDPVEACWESILCNFGGCGLHQFRTHHGRLDRCFGDCVMRERVALARFLIGAPHQATKPRSPERALGGASAASV